jgi:hypothetical protein
LPELGGVESCGTREERVSSQFFQFAPHCRQTLMPSFSPVLFQDAAFPFVAENRDTADFVIIVQSAVFITEIPRHRLRRRRYTHGRADRRETTGSGK